ncbi:MAG: tRNA (adenosine(37)-N6)-threonylcarbamoyltransferase complex ATPase subunit type 1 TsaE [Candidatus Marinimicrobia bacterium]|nr:tRNA (adenosine(37)-N6)-threonylcarbamoyltransferase complex ATPase subunit type 1 TsaE [Candidatus Neomarinimicrobiota bacterium]
MFEYHFHTGGSDETKALAMKLAAQLRPGEVLAMSGDLASGKTTFTQGITQYFQIEEYALSPTFTYINEYHGKTQNIVHIDAYRLTSGSELVAMGLWDYYNSGAIIIIEWADIVADAIPEDAIGLSFKTASGNENGREIKIISPRDLSL